MRTLLSVLFDLDGKEFHAEHPGIEGEALVDVRTAESHLTDQSLLTCGHSSQL